MALVDRLANLLGGRNLLQSGTPVLEEAQAVATGHRNRHLVNESQGLVERAIGPDTPYLLAQSIVACERDFRAQPWVRAQMARDALLRS
jgi:hypothetical protein